MNYINLLEKLGLSKKEAKLYLIALETGPATIAKLAQKSGVKRGTIYEFLDEMISKGLLEIVIFGKRKFYRSVEPKKLNAIIERQKEILDSLIPDLSLITASSTQKPKVRYYEGNEGLVSVYYEIFNLPPESEVVGYATFEGVYKIFSTSAIEKYIKKRVVAKISQKLIIPSDEYSQNHISDNKLELRETIIVPKNKFNINNEINIYNDKVAIISLGEEKAAVVIESKQIADTQKAIFNLLWENLRK